MATPKDQMNAHGLTLLLGNHTEILKLKRKFKPSNHGNKVWDSSWLLIDYLCRSGAIGYSRVLELGCGWGLTGVYCAKKQGASVICSDPDEDVQPYLNLIAKANHTKVDFLNMGIDQIKRNILKEVDVIIGSDICFCDTMIDPLRRLINRAKKASVKKILLCDPGRWPFEDLAELLEGKKGVALIDWETHTPKEIKGKILEICF
ncbi:MAG: hypothetical protein JEZ11_27545 [Desulfobacterales bacterium]|nr:hypothetical protein [Desulfobacterales bacterium]